MHRESTQQRQVRGILHHARYHEKGMPYHITSNTLRGEFFLHPTPAIKNIINGVIGRAQHNLPRITLYAYAFLSNHFHLLLEGNPGEISQFVGFVKREISRRINRLHSSSGSIWHGRFSCTALPTPASQLACFRYILSQSVKENIVTWSADWPGAHCANPLLTSRAATGDWLHGTAYSRAVDRGRQPKRSDYTTQYEIRLTPLPQWQSLDPEAWRREVRALAVEIAAEAEDARRRSGKTVLGVDALMELPHTTRRTPSPRRRCIVAWADPDDDRTVAYLERYTKWQHDFRRAADCYRRGAFDVDFPVGAWRPSTAHRLAA